MEGASGTPARRDADTPQQTSLSQHGNALAVLYDLVPTSDQAAVLAVLMTDDGIDPPSGLTGTALYFSYYLAAAAYHAGVGDRCHRVLDTRRDLLLLNFTTWPEHPEPPRSDSHAWSAHPPSGLLNYVAANQSAAPGFAKVRITPRSGKLR